LNNKITPTCTWQAINTSLKGYLSKLRRLPDGEGLLKKAVVQQSEAARNTYYLGKPKIGYMGNNSHAGATGAITKGRTFPVFIMEVIFSLLQHNSAFLRMCIAIIIARHGRQDHTV
jgi:hypothetical protein